MKDFLGFWGDTRSWLIAGSVAAGAIILSLIAHRIVFFLLARFSQKRHSHVSDNRSFSAPGSPRFSFSR